MNAQQDRQPQVEGSYVMDKRPPNGAEQDTDPWDISITGSRRNTRSRGCDWEGCEQEGLYPAPKSPQALREYLYFCKPHIQEYNKGWNFFADMSVEQCEQYRHSDATWHRPTWRLGESPINVDREDMGMRDIHELFAQRREAQKKPTAPPHLRRALEVMDLPWPVTFEQVRAKRNALVKEHHPDRHQGDPSKQEHLKAILAAYDQLRQELS